MGFLSKLFNKKEKQPLFEINIMSSENDNFDYKAYQQYNEERIKEFKDRYDLSTIEGIKSIPISEAKRYPDGGKSVVYMPEQILNRQATEYKKTKRMDLAIECLKKANELYPYSFYSYQRNDYERLVEYLILNNNFDAAKKEHNNLNLRFGTRLDELKKLQEYAETSGTESKEDYYERVIKPNLCEERDREEYYWLLENIPNIAPKSFGAYRRMKNTNSENYQKIAKETENKGNSINIVKFWY